MKLNDLFTRDVVTAGPEEALAGIALRMQEHNVGTVVIVARPHFPDLIVPRRMLP